MNEHELNTCEHNAASQKAFRLGACRLPNKRYRHAFFVAYSVYYEGVFHEVYWALVVLFDAAAAIAVTLFFVCVVITFVCFHLGFDWTAKMLAVICSR